MADHEHNEDCTHEAKMGVLDLLELVQKIRYGPAWDKFVEMGFAEDHDDSYKMLPAGAPMVVLGMLLAMEMVEDSLATEEDKKEWSDDMLHRVGHLVSAMGKRGLLAEEIESCIDSLKEKAMQRPERGTPEPGEWVSLS